MLLLRLVLRNLTRHTTKTVLTGSLIALGAGLLFFANSIFQSTGQGLKTSFVGSLTGDFVIGMQSDESFGLFGSEVPIVSEYERIPPIADFESVLEVLKTFSKASSWTPVVSAAAQISIGEFSSRVPLFGIDNTSYFNLCSDIKIRTGDPALLASGGVFINSVLADSIETSLGRRLELGEAITLSMFTNGSFRVKRGILAGIYQYPAPTDVLDRIVLADPIIVRALCDYTLGYTLPPDLSNSQNTGTIEDMDSLFLNSDDIYNSPKEELSLKAVETALVDTEKRDNLIRTDSAAWSFILMRTVKSTDTSKIRHDIEKELRQKQVNVRVFDWKTAAGSTALMLFAIQAAFNIGIGFLLLGASLIMMNILVISVLERTNEIGSMRALGASKGFIRSLFVLETFLLTLISAVLGLATSVAFVAFFNHRGIPLENSLLITLFGGRHLYPAIMVRLLFTHLFGAILIGTISWIYPVSIALKIEPISAMEER